MLLSRAVVSSEGSSGDEALPPSFQVDPRGCWQDSVTQAVGLRAQVPHWLLAGGLLPFLPTWTSPRSAHNTAADSPEHEQEKDLTRAGAQDRGCRLFCNLILNLTSNRFF